MSVELCLELLATGRVPVLGDDFVENTPSPYALSRDWGLIEAHYGRADPAAAWECRAVTIQAQRTGDPPLWTDLRTELERHGHELVPGPFATPYAEYWTVVASHSNVCVDTDDARYLGRAVKLSSGFPPVPDGMTARDCLAAAPMTPVEFAALPANWRDVPPQDVRRYRRTLALVRHALSDPGAPDPEIAAWRPVLPATLVP
jgi:hypothetical protein